MCLFCFLGASNTYSPEERLPASKKREGRQGPFSATTDDNLQQMGPTRGSHILKQEDKGICTIRNQLSPSVQKGSGKHLLLGLGSARNRGRGKGGPRCGMALLRATPLRSPGRVDSLRRDQKSEEAARCLPQAQTVPIR